MTEEEKLKAEHDRDVRGFIIRSLDKGFHRRLLVRQLTNTLFASGFIFSPDISEYLDYLMGDGPEDAEHRYIEPIDGTVTAYTAYADDALFRLTRRGIDLAQGRFKDPGIKV